MDTEAAETGSSSKKVELHIVDAVSDAAHDYNKQSTPIVIEAVQSCYCRGYEKGKGRFC